jgi:hypothetical protein
VSVDPAAGASAPVWAAAAVGGTAATCAPVWSAAGASTPIWAAIMGPLMVHGCPVRRLLSRGLPCQLELIVSIIVGRNRDAGATGAQSLELYCHRTCCIHRRCCFYFCHCCC